MKLILAMALALSSTFSLASDQDVRAAIAHEIKSSHFACNWSSMLNTMSDFEAQYKVSTHLEASDTQMDINETAKTPYINTISKWHGGLSQMTTKVVLNSDFTHIERVDFTMMSFKQYRVNVGTILKPSYETRTSGKVDFQASCLVR